MVRKRATTQRHDRRLSTRNKLDRRTESRILTADHTIDVRKTLTRLARGDVNLQRIARREANRAYIACEVRRAGRLRARRTDRGTRI